jgi:hypothetical protein
MRRIYRHDLFSLFPVSALWPGLSNSLVLIVTALATTASETALGQW